MRERTFTVNGRTTTLGVLLLTLFPCSISPLVAQNLSDPYAPYAIETVAEAQLEAYQEPLPALPPLPQVPPLPATPSTEPPSLVPPPLSPLPLTPPPLETVPPLPIPIPPPLPPAEGETPLLPKEKIYVKPGTQSCPSVEATTAKNSAVVSIEELESGIPSRSSLNSLDYLLENFILCQDKQSELNTQITKRSCDAASGKECKRSITRQSTLSLGSITKEMSELRNPAQLPESKRYVLFASGCLTAEEQSTFEPFSIENSFKIIKSLKQIYAAAKVRCEKSIGTLPAILLKDITFYGVDSYENQQTKKIENCPEGSRNFVISSEISSGCYKPEASEAGVSLVMSCLVESTCSESSSCR